MPKSYECYDLYVNGSRSTRFGGYTEQQIREEIIPAWIGWTEPDEFGDVGIPEGASIMLVKTS